VALPDFVTKGTPFTPTPPDKDRSPLRWMWGEAVKEWK
jgi:hypothetical protein